MQKLNTYESTPWVAGYQCCIIIYTFISFGLILVSVFNQSILLDEAPSFYSDWDNNLINDIKIQQSCDNDYVSLLNFTWPGTEKGCDCTQSNGTGVYAYKNFYYLECSEYMLSQNCKSAQQISSALFHLWPIYQQTTVQGFKICGKLSSYTAKQAFYIGDLQEGHIKCGNLWQVPSSEQCPIQSIDISDDINGVQIGSSNLYYNITRVSSSDMPLVEFTVGFNSICYKTSDINQFQYLDKMINYECYIDDSRYTRLTNDMLYTQLLDVNSQLSEYNELYAYTTIASQNVNLFFKQLTQFYYNSSALCQQEDLDFIYDLRNYIQDNVMDVQIAAEVIVGIQAGVFGFLIPFISAISIIGCDFKYSLLNRKSSIYKDLFAFWLGIKMIGEIVCTVFLAADMGYQQSMMNHFSNYIDADCSDPITLSELNDFYNNYDIKVYNYVLLNFILCIITNVLDLFVTYLMCRDKHKNTLLVPKESRTHPKNFTSTHPDELLNKSYQKQKLPPIQQKNQNQSEFDYEIKDDHQEKHVPED